MERRKLGKCAVISCKNKYKDFHHYLPWYIFGDTPFTVQLCEEHHKEANEIISKNGWTPKQYFQFIYDFIRR